MVFLNHLGTKSEAPFLQEGIMFLYLNFICLKQIIFQMYFDITFSHARKTESLCTLDLSSEK